MIQYLAQETGGHILLEDGVGAILLETNTVEVTVEEPGSGGNRIYRPRQRRQLDRELDDFLEELLALELV